MLKTVHFTVYIILYYYVQVNIDDTFLFFLWYNQECVLDKHSFDPELDHLSDYYNGNPDKRVYFVATDESFLYKKFIKEKQALYRIVLD